MELLLGIADGFTYFHTLVLIGLLTAAYRERRGLPSRGLLWACAAAIFGAAIVRAVLAVGLGAPATFVPASGVVP